MATTNSIVINPVVAPSLLVHVEVVRGGREAGCRLQDDGYRSNEGFAVSHEALMLGYPSDFRFYRPHITDAPECYMA